MKFRKAPELLKKAATSFKSKTHALRTMIIVLASLRRRMALVGAASRRIHALVSSDGRAKHAKVDYYDRALVLRKATAAVMSKDNETAVLGPGHGVMAVDFSEMEMFEVEHGHGFFPDWAQSLFDDENYVVDDEDVEEDEDDLVMDEHEPSVIEVIRSNREVHGLEFKMDEEIDEACDMFIRRFRSRMNRNSYGF